MFLFGLWEGAKVPGGNLKIISYAELYKPFTNKIAALLWVT